MMFELSFHFNAVEAFCPIGTCFLYLRFNYVPHFSPIADIQEFYELTLLDDTKTIQQKTVETLQIATKWEQENSAKISAAEVSLCFDGDAEYSSICPKCVHIDHYHFLHHL